jgi:DNA-binding NtrC family response regulator
MANILIVEDDKILNKAYEMILTKEGHKVALAFNGKEALRKVDDFKPDLILLDLLMPEMSGLEFLRVYDIRTKHPDVKVLIFSNMENPPEVEEAHKLGAYKYIVKAWSSPRNLTKLISEALSAKTSPATK